MKTRNLLTNTNVGWVFWNGWSGSIPITAKCFRFIWKSFICQIWEVSVLPDFTILCTDSVGQMFLSYYIIFHNMFAPLRKKNEPIKSLLVKTEHNFICSINKTQNWIHTILVHIVYFSWSVSLSSSSNILLSDELLVMLHIW